MANDNVIHVIRPGPDQFGVAGHASDDRPLYYPQCGLPIFLVNGFRRETIEGDETVTIENLDGLWTAIGIYLVSRKKQLLPKEIRFLRHHMDLTQAELGQVLRTTDQTVARWEKGMARLYGPADVALRTAFLMSPAAQPKGQDIVCQWFRLMKDLTDAEDSTPTSLKFSRSDSGWEQPAAA
jgi:transcriptional regulator with XRE-family HTH domain